jgi:hypothetical protein
MHPKSAATVQRRLHAGSLNRAWLEGVEQAARRAKEEYG